MITKMKRNHYLGVMALPSERTPPFAERNFFRLISQSGGKTGINVFVFSPHDVDFTTRTITGYRYLNDQGWTKSKFPFPALIYDRCFYTEGTYQRLSPIVEKLKHDPQVHFLGLGLRGKWESYQILSQHENLLPFLPSTELVTSSKVLQKWLSGNRSCIVKPVGGSLGQGVIRLKKEENKVILKGRNLKNHIINEKISDGNRLYLHLVRFFRGRTFLIQPYLSLSTPKGEPFDIRVLVQKTAIEPKQSWSITGIAVRQGMNGGITSNLHGGGRAYSVKPFLAKLFPEEKVNEILASIQLLAQETPVCLENRHGPLIELGMDIGVDRQGKVWLIELNSKPGREIFRQLHEPDKRKNAMLNPIRYARKLLESNTGGYSQHGVNINNHLLHSTKL